MKFTLLVSLIAASLSLSDARPTKRDVDPALVPDFGHQAGLNPTGTGDCDGIPGANGQPIKVPCACPPPRDQFIASLNANVAAGHAVNNPTVAVSFPSDSSQASQLARINAALVTLQNLNGSGKGCPASSTTFVAQQKAIQAGTAAPPAASSAASAGNDAATALAAGGVDPALVPDFGHQAGLNPTGTGDCDGIPGANGQPIKVPCACPPPRDQFIASLNANVAAGHAVNNPTIAVSFPSDSSQASQLARINAALVTLQNLNGPGKGCPASSTTFVAQQKAIQAGTAAPPAASSAAPAASSATPAGNNAATTPAAGGVDPALVPDFGHQAGLNPTGTGDCDGINGANGQPIKVPCACPPPRDQFIASLNANVAAGKVVNNPTVAVSFPTGNDKASQFARINAALVTLQNLNGPGQGCPASSTTFVAQQQAILALPGRRSL